ncbi:MerR family DNA-binding transcriptional regulator [Streptomyces sp. NPDC047023]|uniref:MerR family DNA-binding transcriptional regulator n=1 Tax=Streptomyces sp. NPDC047023 TaxID=3155139 RepID=UPI0033D4ED32
MGAAGASVQTLRYYERCGLLAEPDRSNGGAPDLALTGQRLLPDPHSTADRRPAVLIDADYVGRLRAQA